MSKKTKKNQRMESRDLPVKLTAAQVADRANELVAVLAEIEQQEDARKEENGRRRGIIRDLKATAQKLCRTVETKQELQAVECVIRMDYDKGRVQVIRDDTGDLVEERALTDDERQAHLDGIEAAETPTTPAPKVIDIVPLLAEARPVIQPSLPAATEPAAAPAAQAEDTKRDWLALVDRAIVVIRETKRASVSTVQRRLRIGYNGACAIMDELQERGIVSGANGDAPRDILVDLDALPPTTPPANT